MHNGYIDFVGNKCEEHIAVGNGSAVHGAPADSIVWHDRDRRCYFMCAMCADHNVKNRGGKLVASGDYTAFAYLFKWQEERAARAVLRALRPGVDGWMNANKVALATLAGLKMVEGWRPGMSTTLQLASRTVAGWCSRAEPIPGAVWRIITDEQKPLLRKTR